MGMSWVGRRVGAEEIAAVRQDQGLALKLLYGDDSPPTDRLVDLDKAWHGLHFLLTGTAWEIRGDAGLAVFGGEEVGPSEGYGPPRLLGPGEVARIAVALADLDDETLRARWDADEARDLDLYPDIWDEPEVLDTDLLPAFHTLAAFYAGAAAADEGALLIIR